MDLKSLAESLHPLERKIIPFLNERILLSDLIDKTGLKEVEVMRALQWLENKKVLDLNIGVKEVLTLDSNGEEYVKSSLPEIRLLNLIKKKPLTLDQIAKQGKLEKMEINVALGILKSKVAAVFYEGKLKITDQGKRLLKSPTLEQNLLEKLNKGPVDIKSLEDEEKFAYDNLKKRKNIIKTTIIKLREATLTELGKDLTKQKLSSEDLIERVTSKMLKEGSWKNKKFRRYDIKINVPKINGGKRHFVNEAINYIKRIWLDLGFVEMEGNLVQTAFWDLDSLFVPQDHPARAMQDTFYLKNPSSGKLPKELVSKIKKIHEDGGNTGSLGWGNVWKEDIGKQNLLRTHTTVLSAQAINKLKKTDLPAKFFSVGKVFRNETLDWKHLFEFYQVEGIVVDYNNNLKNLKGYLKNFFGKMGYPDIRMRPAHFPYTEPSVEVDVYHPVHKTWVELGGAGIFRPEVTIPLFGEEIAVLAWGLGLPRVISSYYGIDDIRDLYRNDLKQIREMKAWMR